MQFSYQLMYGGATAAPQVWDGTPIDATPFPSVTITCTVAPSTPYTLYGGPSASSLFSRGVTISAVGRYDVAGGEHLALQGGSGGSFTIAGSQSSGALPVNATVSLANVDTSTPATVKTTESAVTALSLGALNANKVIPMGDYAALTLNVNTFPANSVVTFYASEDGVTNWVQTPIDPTGSPSSGGYTSQISTTGSWIVPRRSGYLKIEMTAYGGSGAVAGQYTLSGFPPQVRQVTAVGPVAHSAPAVGNPLPVAGVVQTTADTTLASGDVARLAITTGSAAIVRQNAPPELGWQYAAASGGITDTTTVTLKAAAGGVLRNYLTNLTLSNASATDTEFVVKDGATVIWRHMVKAGTTPFAVNFHTPLRGSADTALTCACITTGAAVYINAGGFVAP